MKEMRDSGLIDDEHEENNGKSLRVQPYQVTQRKGSKACVVSRSSCGSIPSMYSNANGSNLSCERPFKSRATSLVSGASSKRRLPKYHKEQSACSKGSRSDGGNSNLGSKTGSNVGSYEAGGSNVGYSGNSASGSTGGSNLGPNTRGPRQKSRFSSRNKESSCTGYNRKRTSSSAANADSEDDGEEESPANNKGSSSYVSCIGSEMEKSKSRSKSKHSNRTGSSQLTFDQKKLLYMKNLLKSQTEKVMKIAPYEQAATSKEYPKYKIFFDQPLPCGPNSCKDVVKAQRRKFEHVELLCKIYDCANGRLAPENAIYLKVIRHLGKKHPHIIQTWGVFYTDNTIFVIQELARHGTTLDLMEANFRFDEKATHAVAKDVFTAMDFLGDMGISHRSIEPAHIFIRSIKPINARLSGFRMSIIYWDPIRDDINTQPCFDPPASPTPEFFAPESYGDPATEEFDPINADLWSYGATLFYLLTKSYPYDFNVKYSLCLVFRN